MEVFQQFETYIAAQKNVAIQFIVVGVVLVLLSGLLHFLGKAELSNGLKIGALICGSFILIGGIAYYNTEDKLLKSQALVHQEDALKFEQVELERMEKVAKDYPVYQIVFGSFIILSILIVWFVKNPYWHGVAFSVIMLFAAVMMVEAYSQRSIQAYLDLLRS